MLQQKVRLRAATPYIQPKIQTVQGDTGRQLVCVIEDYKIPSGASATFWAIKPSGKGVQDAAAISGQEITVQLTNQTLAERGWIACQLQITSGGQTVKTFKFCLDNKESFAGDWPPSENESTWLNVRLDEMQKQIDQAIAQTQAATSAANEAIQEAKDSAADANAAAEEARETVWNNKNLTNYSSAAESEVTTVESAAVLAGIEGKTKQTTTTGAQLLDLRGRVSNNLTTTDITFSGDGELIVNGTANREPNNDIYFVGEWGEDEQITTEKVAFKVYGATHEEGIYLINVNTSINGYGDGFVTTDGKVTAVMMRLKRGKTYNNFKIKPMLNFGESALPWEPYSGGTPAPNPDYPMPVQGIGGETGDESFDFKAVVQSKNLLNHAAWKKSGITRGTAVWKDNGVVLTSGASGDCYTAHSPEYSNVLKIPVKSGKTYVLSWDCDSGSGNVYVFFDGISSNNRVEGSQAKKNTFTVPDGVTFVTFRVGVTPANTTIAYKNVMLTEGKSVPSWQPYLHSEISMALSQPIFEGDKLMQVKAGQGYVDADGATQTADQDLWGVDRQKRILKFDGTEVWNENGLVEGAKKKRYSTAIDGDDLERVIDSDIVNGKSNMFAPASAYVGYEGQTECFSVQNDRFSYLNVYCGFQTVDEWKNHLKTSNMFAVLKARVPYFVPFTDQTPFMNWHTPEGDCTITTDDPMEPIISAYTAQTPEGSYLLTGYVDGLIGRNNQTLINALSNQVLALTQKNKEVN